MERYTNVFVRHGILSNSGNMEKLASELEKIFGAAVNNETYDWRGGVIEHGLNLADEVLKAGTQDVVLVGHSQGGLLCRVAAIALKGIARRQVNSEIELWRRKNSRALDVPKRIAVVLLATPNNGALSLGQMSAMTKLLSAAIRGVGDLFGVNDLPDLVTPRLFKELQKWKVRGVRYLSVSASGVNKFSLIDHSLVSSVTSAFGVHLELPNDGIVEDTSVDLRRSTLPCEIDDLSNDYQHVRCYFDCSEVYHTKIHSSEPVFETISSLKGWLLPPLEPSGSV